MNVSDACDRGLSPPVRRSPDGGDAGLSHQRSIPARAGEPGALTSAPSAIRVYPRPCGGADGTAELTNEIPGLSPPVRGSLVRRDHVPNVGGSIPARAGEPSRHCSGSVREWVYPRPCGGATAKPPGLADHPGLSPPVRGSLVVPNIPPTVNRSIPARAGEPTIVRIDPARPTVYPRPCGGAATGYFIKRCGTGLSPPVRGSPTVSFITSTPSRSIPARAGEPLPGKLDTGPIEVYPRPCGGAIARP